MRNDMKIKHLMEDSAESVGLFRGLKFGDDKPPERIVIKPNDKEYRNPKSTSPVIHDIVNALCYEKFGVYVRNLPFFYKEIHQTYYYGYTYKASLTNDMTFYYADGVFDFTPEYHAVRHDHINAGMYMLRFGDAFKHENFSDDFLNLIHKSLKEVSMDHPLKDFKIRTSKDIEAMYNFLGEKLFEVMLEKGYENKEDKDNIVKLFVKGMHVFFKRFYDYVDLLQSTKNFSEIPDYVEIMVDADEIVLEFHDR